MSMFNYITKTPLKIKIRDVKAYIVLVKEIRKSKKDLRKAANKIHANVPGDGEKPIKKAFIGCMQNHLCWEYEDEMRNTVLNIYSLECPYFLSDTHPCNQKQCFYNKDNNEYVSVKDKFNKAKNLKEIYWSERFSHYK